MRYEELKKGMYVVRTRELSWARVLSGAICLVHGVEKDGSLHVQLTDDCVPKGGILAVGPQADDGAWYDVSMLVLDANSAIAPKSNKCAYKSAVECNYRNFLGLKDLKPMTTEEAEGSICLIGERTKTGHVVFSKTGYYVISVDVNGYAIVYQGFCTYVDEYSSRKLQLRVMNLDGTDRAFYDASAIVDACHSAYEEDCKLASKYREVIRMEVASSSNEFNGGSASASAEFVERLSLEGTA